MSAPEVHPCARAWAFPPPSRGRLAHARRTNLRELAARPERFEHHLTVVARAGAAQLEIATASEPLYFGHVNVSDEYAMALPTGDLQVDAFPLRTFVSDGAGQDLVRYNHRIGDLVLHPLGAVHWPGRLRPPFDPVVLPTGMRRCGLSVVFCASEPTLGGAGPGGTSAGREDDAKAYVPSPPQLLLRDVYGDAAATVARVGDASLELVVAPPAIVAPRGAYVLVLDAPAGSPYYACDLVHVAPGTTLDSAGIARALVFSSAAHAAAPPPPSWERLPAAPIAPIEDAPRGTLPVAAGGVALAALDDRRVAVAIGESRAEIPRYWLARTLFRVALHRPALGYVETYGGLFYDDRGGVERMGIRGGAAVTFPHQEALAILETLYRAAAPDDYVERLIP